MDEQGTHRQHATTRRHVISQFVPADFSKRVERNGVASLPGHSLAKFGPKKRDGSSYRCLLAKCSFFESCSPRRTSHFELRRTTLAAYCAGLIEIDPIRRVSSV